MRKIIAVVNRSQSLPESYARAIVTAANAVFAYDYAPLYSKGMVCGIVPPLVQLYANEGDIPPGSAVSTFMSDASDVPGALAYHTKNGDEIESPIFVPTIMSDGGGLGVEVGSSPKVDAWSVSVAAMHEWLELADDPDCNAYARRGDGKLVARENVDPVEGSAYVREVSVRTGRTVQRFSVSCPNFIGPKWYDLEAVNGEQLDHLRVLSHPFEKLSTGYVDVIDARKIGDTQEMHVVREAGALHRERAYKALPSSRGGYRRSRELQAF